MKATFKAIPEESGVHQENENQIQGNPRKSGVHKRNEPHF